MSARTQWHPNRKDTMPHLNGFHAAPVEPDDDSPDFDHLTVVAHRADELVRDGWITRAMADRILRLAKETAEAAVHAATAHPLVYEPAAQHMEHRATALNQLVNGLVR